MKNTRLHSILKTVEAAEEQLEELRIIGDELRRQNEELVRARRRYADLFNWVPEAYMLTDAGGVIEEANRCAAELLRYPQRFLPGKPLVIFVANEERVKFRRHWSALRGLGAEAETRWESLLRPRSGPLIRTSLWVGAMPDPRTRWMGARWLVRIKSD